MAQGLTGSGSITPSGAVMQYAGSTAPSGWLICDGSAVSRTTYADLYSAIGDTYGNGDGSTTFNLPDMQGNVAVGLDSGDTDFDALGETGGAKTHTLTESEMPSHDHRVGSAVQTNFPNSGIEGLSSYTGSFERRTTNAGNDQPHNNLQPYLVMHYIIKT